MEIGNATWVFTALMAVAVAVAATAVFVFWFLRRRDRMTHTLHQPLAGRYRIGYELGRGMNAITYHVEDSSSPQTPLVAKVLLTRAEEPRITRDSFRRHVVRFRREMEHLEKLQDKEFVVPVHSFYPDAIPPFYVMVRCRGSLQDELTRTPLPLQEVLNVVVDVCQGLVEIHHVGIIHRDLKPANILKYENRWVLADFGMSLLGGEKSNVTIPDSMPGTIPYTAPEVMYRESDRIDATADVFSLGITLKEMFTGTTVWESPTSSLLQNRFGSKTRKEIKLFDGLITRMTSMRSEDRPHDIPEVLRELQSIFQKVNEMRYPGRNRLSARLFSRPLLQGAERLSQIHKRTLSS